ncbi:hypothetical protein PAXINDRAFT_18033, partial [Paxillus involutus ATCC 200175]
SHFPSARFPSHDADDLVTVTVSRAEWANLQDVRRRDQATSTFVTKAVDPFSRPEHDHDSSVDPHSSIFLPQSRGSATHPRSHTHGQSLQSSAGLDPVLLSSSLARDDITKTSPASPVADEQDLQRTILQFQEQLDQLRRRVDDPKRKVPPSREGLDTGADHLLTVDCTQVTHDAGSSSLELGLLAAGAGPSSMHDGPSGSKSTASTPQVGPSAVSDVPSKGHPSNYTQSLSDSMEAEERVKED